MPKHILEVYRSGSEVHANIHYPDRVETSSDPETLALQTRIALSLWGALESHELPAESTSARNQRDTEIDSESLLIQVALRGANLYMQAGAHEVHLDINHSWNLHELLIATVHALIVDDTTDPYIIIETVRSLLKQQSKTEAISGNKLPI